MQMAEETSKARRLTKDVPFVPMLVVNRKYVKFREEMVFLNNVVRYICEHYTGA